MRIAVTYEDGNVFQHFGKTENFKVFEVEDNQIVSSEVVSSNGQGHGALATLLGGYSVDVLICGGIGQGARDALAAENIEVCAGAEGNADEAVQAYLKGELIGSDASCDHHHDHDHEHEEGHECGNCHSEGHECGGCNSRPEISGKNVGKTCKVHYRGTLNDGSQFDSSYDREQPLEFVCGAGMMIAGFDQAVAEMEVGEIKDVHLMPEEAYGYSDPRMIVEGLITDLPGSENLEIGQKVYLSDPYGRRFPAVVTKKDDVNITLDANHEMAGKELNFTIELLSAE